MTPREIHARNVSLTEATERLLSRCLSLENSFDLDRSQTLGIMHVVSMRLAMETMGPDEDEDCGCDCDFSGDAYPFSVDDEGESQ